MSSEEHMTNTIEKESAMQDLTNQVLLSSMVILCKQNQALKGFIENIKENAKDFTANDLHDKCKVILEEVDKMENSDDPE